MLVTRTARRTTFAVAVSLLTSVAPDAASAPPPEVPIRLEYHAGRGCPDEAGFLSRVAVRVPSARKALAGEVGPTFEVHLDSGPPASGRLTSRDERGAGGSRRIRAGTCTQVADALALVVALALAPPGESSEGEGGTDRVQADDGHQKPPTKAPPPPAAPRQAPAAPAPPPKTATGSVFAGVDLSFATEVAPDAIIGTSPFVGWVAEGIALRPMLRLGFERAAIRTAPNAAGFPAVSFAWTVGRLDACHLFAPRTVFRVTACARVEAGALELGASASPHVKPETQAWVALGPTGRIEWPFLTSLFLGGDFGVLFRATQERFVLGGQAAPALLYGVPFLGYELGLGLGARFL